MSTLAYVGFAGAIARGEATVGHARSPSSLPREARTTQPIPCHGGVLKSLGCDGDSPHTDSGPTRSKLERVSRDARRARERRYVRTPRGLAPGF
jgi:hypothetical protein